MDKVLDVPWTAEQRRKYDEDGFLIVERLVDPAFCDALAARYEPLFAGEFETGTNPDTYLTPFAKGDHTPRTRWMTNPWYSDHTIAHFAFDATIGKNIATLNGWAGTRLCQQNIHWKPPGSPPLSMHQDTSYHLWCDPAEMASCWVALSDTTADGGPLLFARGSHKWPRVLMEKYQARIKAKNLEGFLDPNDFRTFVDESAVAFGVNPELVPVVVPKGGGAFFQGWVWHGSDSNRSGKHRFSISNHGIHDHAKFHPTEPANIYGRYKRFGDLTMDEAHFPIVWTKRGYRTAFLDDYMRAGSGAVLAA
jgi:ectoine hydroxylase-related dioxygenase (phytanoyl-CoA dioxygenase family)